MNKEQMFIINEFINKHATKNVWNVSDKLIEMAVELVQVQEKPVVQIDPVGSTCLNAS